jgi:hypothetical protein
MPQIRNIAFFFNPAAFAYNPERVNELKASEKWKWWAAITIVLAFTAMEYGPVFLSGRIPFPATIVNGFLPYVDEFPQGTPKPLANIGDLVTTFYPYHALAARGFRHGSLPLWNPNMLSGAPFVGNTQSAMFYPPNYLYYFVELKRAWALGLVLQRLLAVIFTVLLLRELGGTPTGAVVSALLFGFSGFLIAWQGQAMASSAVWLPLICYALLRLHREHSGKYLALVAIAFAMPVLAGHPETAAHLTMTGSVVAAFLFFKRSDTGNIPNLRFAAGFVAAALLSIGIASIQALPSLEWIRNSHRSLHDVWPSLPLPAVLAFVSRDVMRATNSAALDIPEQAAYLGMVVFLVVPLAVLHTSKKFIVFLAAGCLVLLSIIYGIGPLLPLLNSIPYLGLKQWRFILVLSLGLAVLAGLGISALEYRMEQRTEQERNLRWKTALLATSGLAAGLLMVYLLNQRTNEIVERSRMPLASLILLLISAAVVYARIAGWLNRMQFNILIVSVVAFDVLTFSYGFLPFQRAREVYPVVELFDRLKQLGGDPFRIAQLDDVAVVNSELVYDLDSVQGYEILLERLYRFLDDIDRNDGDAVRLDSAALLKLKDRRVDMLNTRYLLVPSVDPVTTELRSQTDRFRFVFAAGHTDVLENLHALPRAFIVPASGIEVIADEALQLERVKQPSFNPEHSVILAKAGNDISNSGGSATNSDKASVEWIHRDTNSFQLKVNAPTPGVLVASQIYYPGWKASIDGASVPVVPANYALTAISLPSGEHDVRFFYDPASIRIGATVSGISLTIMAALIWFSSRRRGLARHRV